MKKSFRLILALLLIGSCALSFSSCKDSENVSDDPNSPENIALSKESETAQTLLKILSFTSELDSLPDNWASNNYTVEPTVGVINDASSPYVRYVTVTNKEEAINKYNSFAAEGIAKNANSASWNIENVGSMTFKVLDQADVTATLDINIKQQPHLTQIRFVPASALGSNGLFTNIKNEPYYSFGDVVELKEGNNKSYWICVRPCSKLDDKGKSHWFSFQLNDWNDHKLKNVDKGSINFAKLEKSGYLDYYLPYQLGNQSGSREHIPELFKLLMVLDNPTAYKDLILSGIGTNNTAELTLEDIAITSDLWEQKKCWDKVLPENINRTILGQNFENDDEDEYVNVFYHGYSSNPAVYMLKLNKLAHLDIANEDSKYDKISWKREKEAVDFHGYAKWGVQMADKNAVNKKIDKLPNKGYIVRYKTGAQLVGKSFGEDEDYEHSFTVKHKNIISDLYVRREETKSMERGASVMGDIIHNTDEDSYEVCAISYSQDNPTALGNNSYFFKKYNSSKEINEFVLQDKNISALAYIHLIQALILKSDIYKKYIPNNGDRLVQNNLYREALDMMVNELAEYSTSVYKDLCDMVNFRALDSNGNKVTINNVDGLKTFALDFPYKDKNLSKGQFKMGTVTWNAISGTLNVTINNSKTYKSSEVSKLLCLKAYIDIRYLEPTLKDENTQTFIKGIRKSSDRSAIKKICVTVAKKILKEN